MKKTLLFLAILLYSLQVSGQNIRANRVSADTVKYSLIDELPTHPTNGFKTTGWLDQLWATDSVSHWRFFDSRDTISLIATKHDLLSAGGGGDVYKDSSNIFSRGQRIEFSIENDTTDIDVFYKGLTLNAETNGVISLSTNKFNGYAFTPLITGTRNLIYGTRTGDVYSSFNETIFDTVNETIAEVIFETIGVAGTLVGSYQQRELTDTAEIVAGDVDIGIFNKSGVAYGTFRDYTFTNPPDSAVGYYLNGFAGKWGFYSTGGNNWFGGGYTDVEELRINHVPFEALVIDTNRLAYLDKENIFQVPQQIDSVWFSAKKMPDSYGGNIFIGSNAPFLTYVSSPWDGSFNLSLGNYALFGLTTGYANTAIGKSALEGNTSGNSNTALGEYTLANNTTGSGNVAIGRSALTSNEEGYGSIAIGTAALIYAKLYENLAIGYSCGIYYGSGSDVNDSVSYSTYVGNGIRSGADNSVNEMVLGYSATGNGSNTATYGNTSMTDHYFTGTIHADSIAGMSGEGGGIPYIDPFKVKEDWLQETEYVVGDIVYLVSKPSWIFECAVDHTSDDMSIWDDYNLGYWKVIGLGVSHWNDTSEDNIPKTDADGNHVDSQISDNGTTVTIGGTLKISGGSPAAGRVLTSDDYGNSSWTTILGANTYQAHITLSAAELDALYTTPKTVVLSPGSGKAIKITDCTAYINYGSAALTGTDCTLAIIPNGGTTANAQVYISNLNMKTTADKYVSGFLVGQGSPSDETSNMMISNVTMVVKPYADITGGDTTIDLYITYVVITL